MPPGKSFDASAYLAPGSDEVALLVLAHQTQMHNLITLTNYKTRIALHALGNAAADGPLPEATRRQFERPAEQLLRYLLFSKEAALPGLDGKQVIESSAYAREFAARGPRDSKGRSLRDFDLSTRTFRYSCSYLIYTEAFDAIPEPAKSYVYRAPAASSERRRPARGLQIAVGPGPARDPGDLAGNKSGPAVAMAGVRAQPRLATR